MIPFRYVILIALFLITLMSESKVVTFGLWSMIVMLGIGMLSKNTRVWLDSFAPDWWGVKNKNISITGDVATVGDIKIKRDLENCSFELTLATGETHLIDPVYLSFRTYPHTKREAAHSYAINGVVLNSTDAYDRNTKYGYIVIDYVSNKKLPGEYRCDAKISQLAKLGNFLLEVVQKRLNSLDKQLKNYPIVLAEEKGIVKTDVQYWEYSCFVRETDLIENGAFKGGLCSATTGYWQTNPDWYKSKNYIPDNAYDWEGLFRNAISSSIVISRDGHLMLINGKAIWLGKVSDITEHSVDDNSIVITVNDEAYRSTNLKEHRIKVVQTKNKEVLTEWDDRLNLLKANA